MMRMGISSVSSSLFLHPFHYLPPTTWDLRHHPASLRVRFISPKLNCFEITHRRFGLAARALLHDSIASVAVFSGANVLVMSFDELTRREIISQKLSRKVVHILSGLLFAMSWPMFSTSPEARYFASLIPLANCVRLLINGLSLTKDEGLVNSVTRNGSPEELLKGPLYYVIILIICALIFWRDSPVGLVSLAMMCGGDGIADIMGRKFGETKLPYNKDKSWAGSISMLLYGFIISVGMLKYYSTIGYFELEWGATIQRVALVALIATIVESLPTTHIIDDNISVPVVSMLVSYVIFRI